MIKINQLLFWLTVYLASTGFILYRSKYSLTPSDVILCLAKRPAPVSSVRSVRLISRLGEVMKDTLPIWEVLKAEALIATKEDLKASTLMANAVLSQPSFEEALIDYISNQLETPLFPATQIRNLFAEVKDANSSLPSAWALDLLASGMNDATFPNFIDVLLFNQGYQALVTHRMAHTLWYMGRDGLARYFQSTAARIFAADIHPG